MFKILGGIYGIFKDNNTFFIFLSFVILVSLFVAVRKFYKEDKIKFTLWQLIMAGGASNMIDRIFRGYVVDFLSFKIFGYEAAIFNVADIFITVGVFLMIIILFKDGEV